MGCHSSVAVGRLTPGERSEYCIQKVRYVINPRKGIFAHVRIVLRLTTFPKDRWTLPNGTSLKTLGQMLGLGENAMMSRQRAQR